MADAADKSGVLPTEKSTKEQRVILVESLLVTWKVLDHLESKNMLRPRELRNEMRAAECCKPDGGTCCVNKK